MNLRRFQPWLGLAAVAFAFIAAAAWSWRKWPDAAIDFAIQLYIPWQLASGQVLFRDVTHLNGPLSQYFNAALFKIFGVSVTTLIIANLVIAGALIVFIYRLFLKIADQITATAVCLVIVLVFAFSQYVETGNYNYITPYCHEALHGLALAIIGVAFLAHGRAASAGFFFGLVLLTKPELFLAVMVTAGASFLTRPLIGGTMLLLDPVFFRKQWGRAGAASLLPTLRDGFDGRALLRFAGALTIPAALFFAAFCFAMPPQESVKAVLWPWVVLLTTHVTGNAFYTRCLGLDNPLLNLELMFVHFLVAALTLVLAITACSTGRSRGVRIVAGLLLAAAAIAAGFADWRECGRAFPLFLTAIVVVLAMDRVESVALLWSVFALALLAKMGLHSRIWQYGFYLGMPAAAATTWFLTWHLPRRFPGLNAVAFRASVLLFIGIGVTRLLMESNEFYRAKTFAMGAGGDLIRTFPPGIDPQGRAVNLAVDWLGKNTAPGSTFTAFPQGMMINYLARRRDPVRYTNFIPEELQIYGETTVRDALAAARPDCVALVHADTSEHGARFFGEASGSGAEIMRWIDQTYLPAYLIGAEPLRDEQFGIKIFRRR